MKPHRSVDRGSYRIAGFALLWLVVLTGLSSCGSSGGGEGGASLPASVVNSLLDDASPPSGTVTLRSALAHNHCRPTHRTQAPISQ